MSGINKAILVGNMGREIEVKDTTAGKVGKFSLATSRRIKDADRTTWHNVVVWDDKKIEYLQTYTKTGTKLYIEGEIANRKYTDQAGIEKYISEIVVGRFDSKVQIMANGRGEDDPPATRAGSDEAHDEPAGETLAFDDEVPPF